MKRSQLVDALAARYAGNKKLAAEALDAVVDTITREVARGEKVVIKGFGTFEKVLPKKDAKKIAKGKKSPQEARRSFVPQFKAARELTGVVTGVVKLPKLPSATAAKSAAGQAADRVQEAAGITPEAPATTAAGPQSTPVEEATTKAPVSKPAASKSAASKTAASKKAPAKKSSAATKSAASKTTAAKKSPAKKSAAKKTTPQTTTAATTPAEKATAKKATAKKTTAKKTTAKKTTAKKTPPPATES